MFLLSKAKRLGLNGARRSEGVTKEEKSSVYPGSRGDAFLLLADALLLAAGGSQDAS
ncbi:hypothetical protein EYF80_061960 [Liparis tanakae]|uniref:Uncharacterized protein n=1 Tax=Liparis tanakae TaxID=230148 RepID=A0A4Z2EHE8_9TELE|nr:hypothetical protein EYF80_061960 [Liparis tanakae]